MVKEFEIGMHVMENDLTRYKTEKPMERRDSKMPRMSLGISKKMPYDVIVEKVLLLEEQIITFNKSNVSFRDKLAEMETELKNNPMLMDLSENIYLKELVEDIIQKISRIQEVRLEQKLDVCDFQKGSKGMQCRIDMMSLNLIDKCEKGEVKKAFAFLEEKLKEVISLFGDKERDDKDAFFQKKIIKCLSCDKEVENMPKDLAKTTSSEFKVWKRLLNKTHG